MDNLITQARSLSSGTLATLTGLCRYEDIDAIRLHFVEHCEKWVKMGIFDLESTWQEAWHLYATCSMIVNAGKES